MLFEKDPFDMFGQAIDVGIHRSRVYSEVVKAPFAFCERLAVDPDLEQAVAVILIVLERNKLLLAVRFVNGEPSELC